MLLPVSYHLRVNMGCLVSVVVKFQDNDIKDDLYDKYGESASVAHGRWTGALGIDPWNFSVKSALYLWTYR